MLVIRFQFLQGISPFQNIFELDSKLCLDLEILLVGQIYSEFQTEQTGQDGLHFSSILAVQHQTTLAITLMEVQITALTSINR